MESAVHRAHFWQGIDLQWAYGGLLRAIERRTRCSHRAQDALHDAFVRWAMAPGRSSLDEPQAYFRTVVRSVIVDQHRDAQRLPIAGDVAALPDDAGGTLAGQAQPSAQDLYAVRQRLETLQRLLDALPPRCREVFWLFRIEGHSQAEIATRLGISVNMVERHTMRALLDLRAARDMLDA